MKIINYDDENYPQMLKKIKNPPDKIYVEGNEKILNEYGIAIIGSRKCTSYGIKHCQKFVKDFSKYNLNIISGMAVGIDSIAHNSAIKNGAKTIAVLPSGLENIYPKENKNLFNEILENKGAIISEYDRKEPANSKRFLERNRLVCGMSIASLVIEAAYRSGSSVTAKLTLEQEKKVFCIPGNLENEKSIGTNKLIQKGAKLVICAKDIINEYNFLHEKNIIKSNKKESNITLKDKEIYNLITDEPIDFNEILRKSEKSYNELLAELTMLEIDGKIKKIAGNRFILNR